MKKSPVIRNIRDYLRHRAGRVWNLQQNALDHDLWLQEETLTERLLLRMAIDGKKYGLTIRMFNKTQEGVHGADWQWEWLVRTREREIGSLFRVQAKRLIIGKKGQGEYRVFDPVKSKKYVQIRKLIDNAGNKIPVYVFYNHGQISDRECFRKNCRFQNEDSGYRGLSFWGCAIASAYCVRAIDNNTLASMIQGMIPWHRLIDSSNQCNPGMLLAHERKARAFLIEKFINHFQDLSPRRETSSSEPEWLKYLDSKNGKLRKDLPDTERGGSDTERESFFQNYLQEHELAGVAELDFSNFHPQKEKNSESIEEQNN